MKRVGLAVSVYFLAAGIACADFQAGLKAYNEKDFERAVTLWEAEAAVGDSNAQYNLGLLYETGVEGYPKDLVSAYTWYRLAAAQNVKQAQESLNRIDAEMTPGEIGEANSNAIQILGRWYRNNMGISEQTYQEAKRREDEKRKAAVEAERKAAQVRAEKQRELIAQREADAKLKQKLEEESRLAALKAAREQAEEAKRRAQMEQQRKEEEERLAALRAEKEKQERLEEARRRLQELEAKRTGQNVESSSVVVAPEKSVPESKPAQAEPGSLKESNSLSSSTVEGTAKAEPPRADEKTAASLTPTPKVKKTAEVSPTPEASPKPEMAKKIENPPTPKASPTPKIESKPIAQPEKKVEEPKPAAQKTDQVAVAPGAPEKAVSLPFSTDGLDASVVQEIARKSDAVSLESEQARKQIEEAPATIEALKWTLIAAARGRQADMEKSRLMESALTPAQVTEANRRAFDWLKQRQTRK